MANHFERLPDTSQGAAESKTRRSRHDGDELPSTVIDMTKYIAAPLRQSILITSNEVSSFHHDGSVGTYIHIK